MVYSIKLCIDISTSMSLALSICVLFILLIHSVSGAQFLNTTSLSLLFWFTACVITGETDIVPLTNIHAPV